MPCHTILCLSFCSPSHKATIQLGWGCFYGESKGKRSLRSESVYTLNDPKSASWVFPLNSQMMKENAISPLETGIFFRYQGFEVSIVMRWYLIDGREPSTTFHVFTFPRLFSFASLSSILSSSDQGGFGLVSSIPRLASRIQPVHVRLTV